MRKSTYSTYSTTSSNSWLKWAGIVVIFGSFIMLLWYATTNRDSLLKSEDDLELILPSAGAVKVRAENPGGMEVDHRDKQVFNLLDSSAPVENEIEREDLCSGENSAALCNQKLPKVTALAADPKEAEVAAAKARLKPKSADIALLIENYEPVAKPAAQSKPSEIAAPESVKPVQFVKPVQEIAKQTQDKTVKQPKAEIALVNEKDIFTGSAWGVQLASYRNLSGADAGAKIFIKRYPEILKPLTYVTEKINIKDKGTFYRVQFIGLKDKNSAKQACESLKAAGAKGCWYVSR